jgi:hypothetical protein
MPCVALEAPRCSVGRVDQGCRPPTSGAWSRELHRIVDHTRQGGAGLASAAGIEDASRHLVQLEQHHLSRQREPSRMLRSATAAGTI